MIMMYGHYCNVKSICNEECLCIDTIGTIIILIDLGYA